MGFWIFMLAANLLIPLSMTGIGIAFRRRSPRKINFLFGYRTARSMKNQNTWEFAHHHCGRVWIAAGLLLLPLTVAAMLPLLGKTEGTIGAWGGILCVFQLLILILSIIPTELALRRNFDENGQPK